MSSALESLPQRPWKVGRRAASQSVFQSETPTCKSVEALGPDGLAGLLVAHARGVSGQNWSVPLSPALGQDAVIVFIWSSHHPLWNSLNVGTCKHPKARDGAFSQLSSSSEPQITGDSLRKRPCSRAVQHWPQGGCQEQSYSLSAKAMKQEFSVEPRLGISNPEADKSRLKIALCSHNQNSSSTRVKSQACKIIKRLYFNDIVTLPFASSFLEVFGLFCTQLYLVTIIWSHVIS